MSKVQRTEDYGGGSRKCSSLSCWKFSILLFVMALAASCSKQVRIYPALKITITDADGDSWASSCEKLMVRATIRGYSHEGVTGEGYVVLPRYKRGEGDWRNLRVGKDWIETILDMADTYQGIGGQEAVIVGCCYVNHEIRVWIHITPSGLLGDEGVREFQEFILRDVEN